MPHKSSLPLNWRRKEERYRMKATKCLTCGEIFFPPRMICPTCRRKGKITCCTVPEEGTLYSYTTLYSAPESFEENVPYVLGIIDLNGTKVMAQLTDIDSNELKIGMKMKSVFRKVCEDGDSGIIHYSFKFTKV